MRLREVLDKTEAHFKKLGMDRPRFEAEMALSAALKWKRMDLFLKLDFPLQDPEIIICREYVARRSKGEPLAYMEEQKEFYGINFYVDKNVLIPRPETEHVVDKALELIKKHNLTHLLDIGTGSGCIPVAILKNVESLKASAVDISAEAVAIATKNAESNSVGDRINVQLLDFSDKAAITALDFSTIDLVTSNPPYIGEEDPEIQKEVKVFEPHIALFAKNNGLALYETWFTFLAEVTRPQTHFVFEIGYKQRQEITKILIDLKVFADIECIKDYSGRDRIIYCVKK
jgi:release factor glutamine methyltransferase